MIFGSQATDFSQWWLTDMVADAEIYVPDPITEAPTSPEDPVSSATESPVG